MNIAMFYTVLCQELERDKQKEAVVLFASGKDIESAIDLHDHEVCMPKILNCR